jgi:hypothetical protein
MPIPGSSGAGAYGFKLRERCDAATIRSVDHGLQVLGFLTHPSLGFGAATLSFELALKNHIQALGSATTRPSSHSVRRPIAAKLIRDMSLDEHDCRRRGARAGVMVKGRRAAVSQGQNCAVDLVRDWDGLPSTGTSRVVGFPDAPVPGGMVRVGVWPRDASMMHVVCLVLCRWLLGTIAVGAKGSRCGWEQDVVGP